MFIKIKKKGKVDTFGWALSRYVTKQTASTRGLLERKKWGGVNERLCWSADMREADRKAHCEKRGRGGAKEAREERTGKERSKRQERKEGKEKRKSCALKGTFKGYTCHIADNGMIPGDVMT